MLLLSETLFLMFMCMSSACKCSQKPEEGIGSPRAGVAGECELPDVGAGNQT